MSVGLTVDSEGYLPGQTIAARVDVGGDGDDKLRALRVELRYHNTYYPFQHIGILSLEFHVDKLSRPLL